MNYVTEMLNFFYYMFTHVSKTEIAEYFFYIFIMALVVKFVREAITC